MGNNFFWGRIDNGNFLFWNTINVFIVDKELERWNEKTRFNNNNNDNYNNKSGNNNWKNEISKVKQNYLGVFNNWRGCHVESQSGIKMVNNVNITREVMKETRQKKDKLKPVISLFLPTNFQH